MFDLFGIRARRELAHMTADYASEVVFSERLIKSVRDLKVKRNELRDDLITTISYKNDAICLQAVAETKLAKIVAMETPRMANIGRRMIRVAMGGEV